MDICHLYVYERDALKALKEFVDKHIREDEHLQLFSNKRDRCDLNGDSHWFIGQDRYRYWCMGRTYLLDGKKMHSGYLLRGKNETD